MPEEDLIELRFRLYDGTDIGPIRYSSTATVAMLKERIISEWPRDKKIIPKVANDVKLISGGKVLENGKTIAQCKQPFGELPGGVVTMHVVVQPSSMKTKSALSIAAIVASAVLGCIGGIEVAALVSLKSRSQIGLMALYHQLCLAVVVALMVLPLQCPLLYIKSRSQVELQNWRCRISALCCPG